MCLMEMTFVRPANDRALSFAEIAEKTNLAKSGKNKYFSDSDHRHALEVSAPEMNFQRS
jgi:hypothetical protein